MEMKRDYSEAIQTMQSVVEAQRQLEAEVVPYYMQPSGTTLPFEDEEEYEEDEDYWDDWDDCLPCGCCACCGCYCNEPTDRFGNPKEGWAQEDYE